MELNRLNQMKSINEKIKRGDVPINNKPNTVEDPKEVNRDSVKKKVIELYNNGDSVVLLMQRFKMSKTAIYNLIGGIKKRKKKTKTHKAAGKKLTPRMGVSRPVDKMKSNNIARSLNAVDPDVSLIHKLIIDSEEIIILKKTIKITIERR